MSDLVPELDLEAFEKLTAPGSGPVLVDFWGYGCPPCEMMAPILEQVASLYGDRLRVAKVNANDHPLLASRYSITSVPTLLFLEDGELREQAAGLYPLSMIRKMLDFHLERN